ncbi:hypothetical protein LTR36_004508 [Oleoguttula mirabilis]|uniref:Origin recognition complex subunit 4 n=1 Tax=Oleoguttula mirabilis TaxID=1507867 RepID=A0AAV9JFK4_9PEZI|nr:hypothetical protein LTR36_004508 [Oleoguttula mirabilis]
MDSGRATKRRKLDSPVTYSKKHSTAVPPKPTTANGTRDEERTSAHDDWAEAKAKRLAARQKSAGPEKDVYDDIDGAHSSPVKRVVSRTRKTAPLDPLRNQKAGSLISPAKKPAAKAPAGFFKQFQVPKDKRTANGHDPDHANTSPGPKPTDGEKVPVAAEEVSTPLRKPKPQRSSVVKQPSAKKSAKEAFKPDELAEIQAVLLEKLTGQRSIPLAKLDDEYAKVSQLVTQTITAGESNSMLLIGARGSGKTALVNQILREQAVEHPDDFHVVRLNGFIHTDDKIALREIWRQLGREMELEEDDSTTRNYADTLSTLLALLSHPTEQGREQLDQVTKSVVFILDEFDLFASHPRQTLLYNLFDIAQSRKAPIAVLGLTTRVDVAESLEKRVKSRFSHRYVHLSLAKSFTAFQDLCKAALQVDEQSGGRWIVIVDTLLSRITEHLRRIYYTTKSLPDFMSSMLLPVASLPVHAAMDTETLLEHFVTSITGTSSLAPPDSKLTLLPSLSALQLALLICAARQTAIHNTELISFALAYEEYKVLASKAKLQASASGSLAQGAGARISGKDVARHAWEDLVEVGLVMEDGRVGGRRVDVGLEEIGWSGVELGQWGRWCREI